MPALRVRTNISPIKADPPLGTGLVCPLKRSALGG